MTREGQLPEPAAELLAATVAVAGRWLRREVVGAARRGGVDPGVLEPELTDVVDEAAARLIIDLEALLATDVDAQRTNPLSIFRAAVAAPNALLRRAGASPPPADPFAAERFPDDEYRLGPATWSDVDPSLRQPGLVWGAWKAMTVLQRRREEGLR